MPNSAADFADEIATPREPAVQEPLVPETSGAEAPPGNAEWLTAEECFALLRSDTVGRVVYTADALPAVTPLNYALDGRSIVFRTMATSRLATAIRDSVVAFEVDHIDRATQCGWSVVATGVARACEDSDARDRLSRLGVRPWVAGPRDLFFVVTPQIVTGLRVGRGASGRPEGGTAPA